MENQNYTLGRGEVYLALFAPGTQTPLGERYIGNTPTFSLNIESTNLDHFSSDRGIKEKDESIVNQVNRSATCVTDSIQLDNVALFFFGSKERLTTTSATGQADTLKGVIPGLFYQLGTTKVRPQGVRNVSTVVVTGAAAGGTTYVLGTDYNLDTVRGRIEVIKGGGIAAGTDLSVSYAVVGHNRDRVISGNKPIEAALRYIAHNPEGNDFDYYFPYVKVRPNGDYALKSDEWQQLPLMIDIMKLSPNEAIYVDGQPLAV